MIKLCGRKKEIESTLWSVFTSFGFLEAENTPDFEDDLKSFAKLCYFDKNEAACFNSGISNTKSKAEMVAACIEAAIACGLEDFKIKVDDVLVFDLCVLFGFEKIVEMSKNEINGFIAEYDDICFAKGSFDANKSSCKFDLEKLMETLEKCGIDLSDKNVSESLIFAEKNAEGLAYDVAYNLRVNGCIVEFYNQESDIEKAEEYAKNNGHECILRVYPDGKLLIKELIKNEITQTTVDEFLGYYDEEECDCGHDHDHDDCCSHNHEHH